MLGTYRLEPFRWSSGSRRSILVDAESGLPESRAQAYVIVQVRGRHLSYASEEAANHAINCLYKFCRKHQIDLVERFRRREYLTTFEREALVSFAEKNMNPRVAEATGKVIRITRDHTLGNGLPKAVNSRTAAARLTTIADFLNWLAKESDIVGRGLRDGDVVNIREMRDYLLHHRRFTRGRDRNGGLDLGGLSDHQVEALVLAAHHESERSPFKSYAVRSRFHLCINLLRALGKRTGELLNIRIGDIEFDTGSLHIKRRQDDPDEKRLKGPNVKTQSHTVQLSAALREQTRDYIMNFRRHEPRANEHDYLLVSHKPGRTNGLALSMDAYLQNWNLIKCTSPLLANVRPHDMRHRWNEEFSRLMDSTPERTSAAEEAHMRNQQMGWARGSKTGEIYNERHVARKANELSLANQERQRQEAERIAVEMRQQQSKASTSISQPLTDSEISR